MKQLTIRGIDPEVEEEIRRIARESRKSVNQVLKEVIHQKFKKQAPKTSASSLRQLAGGWGSEEAAEFMRSIRSCEEIDEDMWR